MNRAPGIIAALREEIRQVSPAELPMIIGEVAAVHAEALARLVAPLPSVPAANEDDDRLVSAAEAAKMLGVTSRWVREHQDRLPRVKLPGRALRFSARKLGTMIKRKAQG